MRVLHINATSHTGGASRAMQRLSAGLVKNNHESKFLVGRTKYRENPAVHLIWDEVSDLRTLSDSLLSRIGNPIEKNVGIHPWANRMNLRITETPLFKWADIIDLRNLFGFYFNPWCLPSLSAQKPVFWRLPDLWAITGHCAYPYDCQRWITGCYDCPLFTPEGRKIVEPVATIRDGTRRSWKAKKELYKKSKLHVVITTDWMLEQVNQSILADSLSISQISNGVNLDLYKPRSRSEARKKLGLPEDETILLWAAGYKGNHRKGYHLVVEALEDIQRQGDYTPMLLTMGGNIGWDKPETLQKERHLGYVRDPEKQAQVYAASDAFLCPTLADAQPQTALESLASGIPIIAFDIGPMPELVIDGKTGFIASETTSKSLREQIVIFMKSEDLRLIMRENCRNESIEKYDLVKQTGKYIDLYQSALTEKVE